jgi:hypothetical protein
MDIERIQSVDQMKMILMQELEMDKGIDLIFKTCKRALIANLTQLKSACYQGQITVEFIELLSERPSQAIIVHEGAVAQI